MPSSQKDGGDAGSAQAAVQGCIGAPAGMKNAASSATSEAQPPSARSFSPVPKVIGRGRPVSPVALSRDLPSPTNNASAAAQKSAGETLGGDGNPPSGIVKGRRASIEGNGVPSPAASAGGRAMVNNSCSGAGPPNVPPKGSGGETIALADGWEADVDPRTGKTFYVNHIIKKWSWNPPVAMAAAAVAAAAAAAAAAAGAPKEKEARTQNVTAPSDETERTNAPSPIPANSTVSRVSSMNSMFSDVSSDVAAADKEKEISISTPPKNAKEDSAAQGNKTNSNAPIVPPLILPVVHTPVRKGNDTSLISESKPAVLDPRRSRIEHDREVEELKSEISLIRSQSKGPRRASHLDPWV
jgi:hypothetical protein